jgi:hypothetical protein
VVYRAFARDFDACIEQDNPVIRMLCQALA